MKKILFSDRYGLTEAVLEGRKTMTRRILKAPRTMEGKDVFGFSIVTNRTGEVVEVMAIDEDEAMINNILPKYMVGEVVAVAQSYESIHEEMMTGDYGDSIYDAFRNALVVNSPGWSNKMFVRADLMPHYLRITNVRAERLQDISDEDCIREGVFMDETAPPCYQPFYTFPGSIDHDTQVGYKTPREAFAALIDKISGKGTWNANPYVLVYEFELIK